VRSNFANALADQGRVAEAIAQYQAALNLSPNIPEIHCNLGIALASQGQREAAAAHFEEALRLKPDYVAARQKLQALNISNLKRD
jgi:tetratricopeptide (TPR) repeat protein